MILGKKITIADLEGVDDALNRCLTRILSVPFYFYHLCLLTVSNDPVRTALPASWMKLSPSLKTGSVNSSPPTSNPEALKFSWHWPKRTCTNTISLFPIGLTVYSRSFQKLSLPCFDESELELLVSGMTDINACVPLTFNSSSANPPLRNDWSQVSNLTER